MDKAQKQQDVNSTVLDNPLTQDELRKINTYWQAANYLSVGQIYLLDNRPGLR